MSINWGILGAGNISRQFVHDLLLNNTEATFKHIVKSIGCSSESKGNSFIEDCKLTDENNVGVKPFIEKYDDFYKNKDLDVVYVGTPHVFHYEQVKQCLNHGKNVLCEKPFTINKKEAEELFSLAKEKDLILMEAVWSRFLPIMNQLKSKLKDIGDVNRLFVDFAYDADLANCEASSRIRNNKLGGGALLDIGIYPITYSRFLLDDKVGKDHSKFTYESMMSVDETDQVDYNTSVIFQYGTTHAICTCSNYVDNILPFGRVEGSKGQIELFADNPARLRSFKITYKDGKVEEFKDDSAYLGFIYEANSIAKDIENHEESKVMPADETLLVMEIMDTIRAKHGLKYPTD